MRIYYLDHSGFAVEKGRTLLIFDYHNITTDGLKKGGVSEDELRSFERVYFFASHSHSDHFTKRIFEFAKCNPSTFYVLDSGIQLRGAEVPHAFMSPGDEFQDGHIFVRAFPSTDIGVSFYIEIDDKALFFAGDLNCWHWTLEWSEAEERAARNEFEDALAQVKDYVKKPIDVAFFPVDARMKGGYDDGARQFAAVFKPKLFVPMHFWGDFSVPEIFKKHVPDGVKVFAAKRRGDFIEV